MPINKLNNSYQDYTRQLRIEDAKKAEGKRQSIIEEQKRMEDKRLERVKKSSQRAENSIDIYT